MNMCDPVNGGHGAIFWPVRCYFWWICVLSVVDLSNYIHSINIGHTESNSLHFQQRVISRGIHTIMACIIIRVHNIAGQLPLCSTDKIKHGPTNFWSTVCPLVSLCAKYGNPASDTAGLLISSSLASHVTIGAVTAGNLKGH